MCTGVMILLNDYKQNNNCLLYHDHKYPGYPNSQYIVKALIDFRTGRLGSGWGGEGGGGVCMGLW